MWLLVFLLSIHPFINEALTKIRQCEEIKPLLERVNQEGGFTIQPLEEQRPFLAYWDGDQRKILISLPHHASINTVISSIVFELHNAYTDRRLIQLANLAREGQISREVYIRKVERMEFKNWNHAYIILERGVQSGIFPPGSTLPNYFDDFKEYLVIQKNAGHSAYIGEMFDFLVGYRYLLRLN
jgi:hypothetical protein